MTIWRRIFGGGKPKGQFNENLMRTELASVYGDAYANNPEVYETSYRESPTRRLQDLLIYAQNVFNANQAELMNGFDLQVANLNQQVDTNLRKPIVKGTPTIEFGPIEEVAVEDVVTPRRSFGGGKRKTTPAVTPAVEKDWSHPGRVAEDDAPTPPVSYSPDNSTATGKPREYPFPSSGVDALDLVQLRVWDINYNQSKPKTTAQLKPLPAVKLSNRQLDVYRNPKVINEASVKWMRRNPGKMITSYGFTYYAVPGSGTIMAKANKVPAGYKGGWYDVFSNTKIDKARRKGTK